MLTTFSIRRSSYLDQAHALAAHVKKGFQHLKDEIWWSFHDNDDLLFSETDDITIFMMSRLIPDVTKDLTNKQTNQSEAKLNSSFSHDKTGVDKAKSSTSPNSRAAVDWKKLFISSKDTIYKTYHCNYCHLYQRTYILTASCANSSMFDYYDHQQHWLPL